MSLLHLLHDSPKTLLCQIAGYPPNEAHHLFPLTLRQISRARKQLGSTSSRQCLRSLLPMVRLLCQETHRHRCLPTSIRHLLFGFSEDLRSPSPPRSHAVTFQLDLGGFANLFFGHSFAINLQYSPADLYASGDGDAFIRQVDNKGPVKLNAEGT